MKALLGLGDTNEQCTLVNILVGDKGGMPYIFDCRFDLFPLSHQKKEILLLQLPL